MGVRVAVVGAGGYAGAELVGLLLGHGDVEITGLFGSARRGDADPVPFTDLYPKHRGRTALAVRAAGEGDIIAGDPHAVLLATPAEVSHDLVPALLDRGLVVLDLSGAFRLDDPAVFADAYGFQHRHESLLAFAKYGLAELRREQLAEADLIAVPGCYPTSIVLPLAPLVVAGAVGAARPVIADCVSGVSGAGRQAGERAHLCELSLQPYGVLRHRHAPEIARHAGTPVLFTPHLAAFDRGILSTIHVPLADGWTADRARACLAAAYDGEPFVRLLPEGAWPAVAHVRGTNFCDVGLAGDDRLAHLIVVSAIDNLVKGAAGQAVQCLNIRFGLPETAGLLPEVPACV